MNVEIIIVGVVVICGLAAVIFRRHSPYREDDYGYHVPRTGTWGVRQRSTEEAIRDAERGVAHTLGED